MQRLRNIYNQLSATLATLSQREQRLVLFAGTAICVFIVFLISLGFSRRDDAIRSRSHVKSAQLTEMMTLVSTYRTRRAKSAELERRLQASNVRLLTFLDGKARKAGIDLQTQSPRPDIQLEGSQITESSVEITLTEVKLNRLVDFLNAVEAAPEMVTVKYIRIEPRPGSAALTAWLTIAAYHLN